MYAPVVLRFRTYQVQLNPVCREYADAVLALPALAGVDRRRRAPRPK